MENETEPKPFSFEISEKMYYICEEGLTMMQSHDKDFIILITGSRGSGKSTLAIEMASIMMSLQGKFIDLHKNIIYVPTSEVIKERIETLPPYEPISLDEAIEIGYSLDFLTKSVKEFKKFLDRCRKFKKIIFFLLPQIRDFSSKLMSAVRLWIHIIYTDEKKGIALVFNQDVNFLKRDRWALDEIEKELDRILNSSKTNIDLLAFDTVGKCESFFKRFRNFAFAFEFYRLPKRVYNLYKQISLEENKKMDIQNNPKSVKPIKLLTSDKALMELLGKEYFNGYSPKTIAYLVEKYNIPDKEVRRLLNLYVTIKEIKEARKTKIRDKIIINEEAKLKKKLTENEIKKLVL